MALLRKNIRVLIKTVRLFSVEPQMPIPEYVRPTKLGPKVIPHKLLEENNLPLLEWLKNNETISNEHWATTRKEFASLTDFNITDSNVDMVIVNICLNNKKISTAMSYLQYLWNSSHDMNLLCMVTYIKLCFFKNDNDLTEVEKDYLLKMYNTVRTKYPVLDCSTAECCIMGISRTERWKESLELLEMTKIIDKPRSAAYSAIINAAFKHNESELGWKYLNEVLLRVNPDHSVYIAYLDYCTRNFNGAELEKEIGKMVEFWGSRDVRPYVDVIVAYENALQALGWTTEHTSINTSGICHSCSHKLANLNVSKDQFKKLVHTVRERVIVGDDVYRKTTPEELKVFLDFIERTQPYDIVIDGLNVSYMTKSKAKPNGSQLTDVFRMCINMGKKVLVLGRKHMLQWPKFDYKFMQRNGHVFLANNLSADDPYMLYATLRSGPNAQFVSKDLMRQHKFLLEDQELTKIFKYWQMAHQLIPVWVSNGKGSQLFLKNPPKYIPLAQKDNAGFHVPYNSNPSLQPALIYEPPKSWVCFRKSTTSKRKTKLP